MELYPKQLRALNERTFMIDRSMSIPFTRDHEN